jgi:hypothetical protein
MESSTTVVSRLVSRAAITSILDSKLVPAHKWKEELRTRARGGRERTKAADKILQVGACLVAQGHSRRIQENIVYSGPRRSDD